MVKQVIVVEPGLLEQAAHQGKPALLVQAAKKEHKVLRVQRALLALPALPDQPEILDLLDHLVIVVITEIPVIQGSKV